MCRFLVVLIYIRTCLPIFWSFTRINCELLVSLDNNYQYPSSIQNVIYQWDKIIYYDSVLTSFGEIFTEKSLFLFDSHIYMVLGTW